MINDPASAVYFAYGSNLLFARLYARTPSIVNLGVGRLHRHQISFNKPGGDGSGKCGIEAAGDDHHVLGVLYQINCHEIATLDKIEGVGHGYHNQMVEIEFEDTLVNAFTYYPIRLDCEHLPFDWYKYIVLSGAKENRFPTNYIARIEQVSVQIDSNRQRREANFAISRQADLP